ncbi:MAG: sugar phosphate isomerase/epimerase family protein [Candidatus Asgardarchaeia archaeon]
MSSLEIGFTSLYFFEYPLNKIFKIAKELGFSYIELNSELLSLVSSKKSMKLLASEILELARSYDIKLTLHAPFIDINLLSYNESIQKASWSEFLNAIKFAYLLELDIVTLHFGSFPFGLELTKKSDDFIMKIYKRGVSYLQNILDFASSHNVLVGVENLHNVRGKFPKYVSDFEMLLEDIPDLKITFDLAHAYTISNTLSDELLTRFYDRIINIHVSDVDKHTKQHHLGIGDGIVDFPKFFNQLKHLNVTVPIIIELNAIRVCGSKIIDESYRKSKLNESKEAISSYLKM